MSEDDDDFVAICEEHHQVQRLLRLHEWRKAMRTVTDARRRTVITYYDEPVHDRWGTVTLGEWGGYLIQIMPMIYNDRLVMTPQRIPGVYDYGWCYPKGVTAMLAALTWDPDEHGEPHGYIKRIGAPRAAGARATPVGR
jgi:hypothetical protein